MEKPHLLPPPHQLIDTTWKFDEVIEAVEKSRAAFLNLSSTSTSQHIELSHIVENLFLIDTTKLQEAKHNGEVDWIGYESYGEDAIERGAWEWGSRDMMFDFRLHDDDASPTEQQQQQERMAILTAAANLTGGALHLLLYEMNLNQEEERGWVKALSLAADRDVAPSSLLIKAPEFRDAHGLLSALKKNKRLNHLSLQYMKMSDECVDVLCDFTSLTSLHLHHVDVSVPFSPSHPPSSRKEDVLKHSALLIKQLKWQISGYQEFVVKLANLHPSHSPLAASLQRLHLENLPIDWRRSTGFLCHWPKLKELTVVLNMMFVDLSEEELMDFMDHLSPPTKAAETADSTPATPPQLYSLHLGSLSNELSRSATITLVDALSRSGLPFFELVNRRSALPFFELVNRHRCSIALDPAIKAQLWRNQRNFLLGSDLKRVPATCMRLFICGDPFAGKTTLVSTMRSIYGRKRDRFRALFTGERTKGIEVQAIKKEGIRVTLWDMAGQQEFHAFHGCMFPDIGTSSYQFPSMFMFVWSPMLSKSSHNGAKKTDADFEANFRYWLRFLASKSRQSIIPLRVIVIFTRADQTEFVTSALSNSIDSLRSDFKGVIDILDPPFHVDARKKDSIKAVAEFTFHNAKDMLQGIQLYDICTQVSKQLSKHLKNKNERIITWEKFAKICSMTTKLSNPTTDKAKLNAIAMSLNESGNIIYINGIQHIVLDPNWFCNEIMGGLIHFSNSKASKVKGIIGFEKGYIPKHFLEEKFESITKSKMESVLLVNLMEAMHLCCKIPNFLDRIFIPTILSKDVGSEQLQWTSWTSKSDNNLDKDKDTFVYMGRRLECENKDLTFLTPGLFSRIQVLFINALQSIGDSNSEVTLGKDFIYICFPDKDIIIVFCKAKSEHVIDVLIRADHPTNIQQRHTLTTLAYVEKHIINTLITICAQPTGIQGVKLIESIIRPDCLHDPSRAQERENQCVEITYLKQQLRQKLERGEPTCYDWKRTRKQMHGHLKNDFIDLLGSENYEEVLTSCKAWLKLEAENPLLYSENDEVNVNKERQCQQDMTIKSLESSLLQCHLEDQTLEAATDVEVRSIKVMAKAISILYHVINANHKELLEKMDEIHHELQCMRKDVISKVEKSIRKLLKLSMENKAFKQLPCVPILTTNDHDKNVTSLVTSLLRISSVQVHMYCEHATLPHPVEDQPGITVTSWSNSRLESLRKALPYINSFFFVLTTAVRLGISSVAPFASSFISDWTPHLKLAKEHPSISTIIKSKFDRSTSSQTAHICPSTSEYFNEWQTCLAFILEDNGGVADQNIAEKFCLWRAKIDGGTRVAWLCKKHYEEQRRFP